MALATVLVPQVNVFLEIEKKCQKPMDLKNLRFSPKGSPRKEDGGECFAPCQWKYCCFDFARQRSEKVNLRCPLASKINGLDLGPYILKIIILTFSPGR